MRKRRQRKQRAVNVPQISNIVLTVAATRMLKDALYLVDEAFARNTKPLPHLDFGREILECLKNKIDDILQRENWDQETPFDYNELSLLYAAIHMYLVDLSLVGDQQRMLTCLQLCKQLRRVIEAIPTKELKAPRDD